MVGKGGCPPTTGNGYDRQDNRGLIVDVRQNRKQRTSSHVANRLRISPYPLSSLLSILTSIPLLGRVKTLKSSSDIRVSSRDRFTSLHKRRADEAWIISRSQQDAYQRFALSGKRNMFQS